MNRWNSLDQETVDVGSINSFKGRLDKIRKTRMGFLWILHGPQIPRPHGDWTPVRPHKVSYKVSYLLCVFCALYFYPRDATLARVYAMAIPSDCLCICLSACHKRAVYQNGCMDRADFLLHKNRVPLKIGL